MIVIRHKPALEHIHSKWVLNWSLSFGSPSTPPTFCRLLSVIYSRYTTLSSSYNFWWGYNHVPWQGNVVYPVKAKIPHLRGMAHRKSRALATRLG